MSDRGATKAELQTENERLLADIVVLRRTMIGQMIDDKRYVPGLSECGRFWAHRTSERVWRNCKYCRRDVPTFLLSEGRVGNSDPVQVLRCCWECGYAISQLKSPLGAPE